MNYKIICIQVILIGLIFAQTSDEVDNNLDSVSEIDSSTVNLIIETNNNINLLKNENDKILNIISQIDKNTQPRSFFRNLIDNVIFQKIYDSLFGNKENPGLIPLIISIIGLFVGFLKIYLLFRKKESKGLLTYILLLIISILLFIISNQNFKSINTTLLKELKNEMSTINKNISDLTDSGIAMYNSDGTPQYDREALMQAVEEIDIRNTETIKNEMLKLSYKLYLGIISLIIFLIIFIVINRRNSSDKNIFIE